MTYDALVFLISFCTIRFYTEALGMKLLRKRDVPEEKYSNAFLGFGPEESHFVVELTYSMILLSRPEVYHISYSTFKICDGLTNQLHFHFMVL